MGSRTAFGTTALVVGANLPDIDIVAYLGEPQADLAWRRGWTHGVLALLLLPLLLTGLLLLVDRLRPQRGGVPHRLIPGQVLLLSAIAILSHPILDSLNTYGMRWLMPFSGRWFYGDALFIVDPWVWLTLGAGVLIRPRGNVRDGRVWARPAFVALSAVGTYAVLMALAGRAAAAITSSEVAQLSGRDSENVMAGPVPGSPLVRRFVVAQNGAYRVGLFRWLTRPHVDRGSLLSFPGGRPSHPAFELAVATPPAQRFLGWARFPTFAVESVAAGYLVHIVDLRYAENPGASFGAVSIPVSRAEVEAGARY